MKTLQSLLLAEVMDDLRDDHGGEIGAGAAT